MKVKIFLIFCSILSLSFLFTNCGKPSSSSSPDGNAQTTPTPVASEELKAWDAVAGEPVVGATLLEGWTDFRILPSPINIDGGWTDSAHIAASGKSLYFTYSRQNDWVFMNSGGTVHQYDGPVRDPAMQINDFQIFRADITPTGWKVVYHPVNANDANYPEAAASTNVNEDIMVFTRWSHAPPSDGNIWFSTKTNGNWSTPAKLPAQINSSCEDDNAFVVGTLTSTVHIFFESNRTNDAGTACGGRTQIYFSVFDPVASTFSPVQKVPGVNGAAATDSDFQFFVTPDLSKAYWTAARANLYGIVTADRQADGSYANMRLVAHPTYNPAPYDGRIVWIGEANIAEVPEGWLMYLACGIATGTSASGEPDNVHVKLCRMKKPR